MAALSEFSLIQHYFTELTSSRHDIVVVIGDDCALLKCPEEKVLAVSIDTLVADIHFFSDVNPETLGHKSLAVGLSDLAAMGATPAWFTLALTLPKVGYYKCVINRQPEVFSGITPIGEHFKLDIGLY